VLEVLYHRAMFGGAWISHATGVAKNVNFFYRQHCTQRNAPVRYLSYSVADFQVFRPAGCTDGVKFGTSMPNFTPIGATVRA